MELDNYPAFPDGCRKSLSGMCREYVGNVSLGIIPFGKNLVTKVADICDQYITQYCGNSIVSRNAKRHPTKVEFEP
jgi:hypothetical protein